MSESLNAATFDVAEMFLGSLYPTEEVSFYTDAAVAYEFHRLSEEAIQAIRDKDESAATEIETRRDELIRKAADKRYVIHLRGQSRDNRRAIINQVRAKYPADQDFLGREKANPEADEMYANLTWALHIEKIVRPDGAVLVGPDAEVIKVIRGNAPDSELAKVEQAIMDLSEGVKSGFEALAQEHDFLSSASPEA